MIRPLAPAVNAGAVQPSESKIDDRTGPIDAKTARQMKLERACRDFESLFLAHLLKSMRQTTTALGGRERPTGTGLMTEMVDEQMARLLAKGGGLGLASMLKAKLDARSFGEPGEGRLVQTEILAGPGDNRNE